MTGREKPGRKDAPASGIDKQSEVSAELQIGPTTLGMVRLYVKAPGVDLPMDFTAEEAREIAGELTVAADRADQA